MKSYFKDYKLKMIEEDMNIKQTLNFENQSVSNSSKALFVKKKVVNLTSNNSNEFLFNFNNDDDEKITEDINKLELN